MGGALAIIAGVLGAITVALWFIVALLERIAKALEKEKP